jgi:hypothetical protein
VSQVNFITHHFKYCYLIFFAGLRGFESKVTGFDLNSELQAIATAAPSGEQGPDGKFQ